VGVQVVAHQCDALGLGEAWMIDKLSDLAGPVHACSSRAGPHMFF
jgi:hypothetical protein